MALQNLLHKAEKNCIAGNWAEKQSLYDVAVSRYYYCLYEKTIYIQKTKSIPISGQRGTLSHESYINEIRAYLKDRLSEEETTVLAGFNTLTGIRNTADYREHSIEDKNDFNLSFKWSFNKINDILDRLIG